MFTCKWSPFFPVSLRGTSAFSGVFTFVLSVDLPPCWRRQYDVVLVSRFLHHASLIYAEGARSDFCAVMCGYYAIGYPPAGSVMNWAFTYLYCIFRTGKTY